jgi:hypothetical protein
VVFYPVVMVLLAKLIMLMIWLIQKLILIFKYVNHQVHQFEGVQIKIQGAAQVQAVPAVGQALNVMNENVAELENAAHNVIIGNNELVLRNLRRRN